MRIPTVRAAQTALILAAFGPILWEWVEYVSAVARINYCLLAPVLALVLGIQGFRRPQSSADLHSSPSRIGYLCLLGGSLLLALGSVASIFTVSIAGFPLAIIGLVGIFGGRSGLVHLRYALLMLMAMVPVPLPLLDSLTPFMVKVSGATAVHLVLPFDPDATWIGADLSYRGWTLFVAEACSGSGTLLVLGTLTLFMAGLFRMRTKAIILTLLLVGPLTIFINGLRIAAIAWILDGFGPAIVTGSGHEILGQVVVITGATGLALVVDRCSRRTFKEPRADMDASS